jgi:hypothetical protein
MDMRTKEEIQELALILKDLAYTYYADEYRHWLLFDSILEYTDSYSGEFQQALYKEIERIYKEYEDNYEIVEKEEPSRIVKYTVLQRKL